MADTDREHLESIVSLTWGLQEDIRSYRRASADAERYTVESLPQAIRSNYLNAWRGIIIKAAKLAQLSQTCELRADLGLRDDAQALLRLYEVARPNPAPSEVLAAAAPAMEAAQRLENEARGRLSISDAADSSTGKSPTQAKRSTAKGEARAKLIAALTRHHEYADGGCLNLEPIGNNELARLAGVSPSTTSGFFNKEFGGHEKYRATCRDAGSLADALKALRREYTPRELAGKTLEAYEAGRRHSDDD